MGTLSIVSCPGEDIQNNPQLAAFFQYISSDMTVKEELIGLGDIERNNLWN